MNDRPARLLFTLAGTTAIAWGSRRHGAVRTISLVTGAAGIAYGALGRSRVQRAINSVRSEGGPVTRVITVGRPKEELYAKWKDPEFMSAVYGDSLQVTYEGQDRIRERLALPGGRRTEWTSRISEQQPNAKIVWRTEPGAAVSHEMFVEFRQAKPDEWGTEVTIGLAPLPGHSISKLIVGTSDFAVRTLLNKILRRFKALVETGEIPTLSHNPAGQPRMLAAA